MRRLFMLAVMAISLALGTTGLWAGNQDEANRIAKMLGDQFPQYNVEVAYQEGKVRLRGEIGSRADGEMIIAYVKSIPKVRSVADSFVISAEPQTIPAQNAPSYADQTSPIATTVKSGAVLPVSALRADEPIFIAQTVEADIPLSAPPQVTGGGAMTISTESGSMPMGVTIPAQNGQYQYQTVSQGATDYMAPQGQPMTAGQSGQPNLPNYAWPTTADYPNYSQVSYPKQYAGGAFPYVGPFYPYPQVPLGWRKVTMEWHDGYWWLDFNDGSANGPFSPLFRQPTKYR